MAGERIKTIILSLFLLITLVNSTLYPTRRCGYCLRERIGYQNCSSEDLSFNCGREILKHCPVLSTIIHVMYYDRTGLCYSLHRTATTWYKAMDKCEEIGGRLLKMENAELQVLPRGQFWFYNGDVHLVLAKHLGGLWIGATDSGSGKFRWTDGTPVVLNWWHIVDILGSFFKNIVSQRVLCISSNRPMWKREECNERFQFICEHDASVKSMTLTTYLEPESTTSVGSVASKPRPRQEKRRQRKFRKTHEDFYLFGSATVDAEESTLSLCLRHCGGTCERFNYNGKTRRCRAFKESRETDGEMVGEYSNGWEVYEMFDT